MKWSVDPLVRAGDVACAAIVEHDVSVRGDGWRVTAFGRKRPIIVLLQNEERVSGIGIDGRFYDATEINQLFPRAVERFTATKGAADESAPLAYKNKEG